MENKHVKFFLLTILVAVKSVTSAGQDVRGEYFDQLELSVYKTYMYTSLELTYSKPSIDWYSGYSLVLLTGPFGETKSVDGYKKSLIASEWYQRFGLGYQLNRTIRSSRVSSFGTYFSSKLLLTTFYGDGVDAIGVATDTVSGEQFQIVMFYPEVYNWTLSLHLEVGLRYQYFISSNWAVSTQLGIVSNELFNSINNFNPKFHTLWNASGFRTAMKVGIVYSFDSVNSD